jgi:hypothetical protein
VIFVENSPSGAIMMAMDRPPITVVELPAFLRSATAAGMSDEERAGLVDFIARHPLAGDLVKETGGLRKLRWQRDGGGKSGGYRAIYYFHDHRVPIYAFLAYGKNRQADLTPAQKKAAADMVAVIKALIRERHGGET